MFHLPFIVLSFLTGYRTKSAMDWYWRFDLLRRSRADKTIAFPEAFWSGSEILVYCRTVLPRESYFPKNGEYKFSSLGNKQSFSLSELSIWSGGVCPNFLPLSCTSKSKFTAFAVTFANAKTQIMCWLSQNSSPLQRMCQRKSLDQRFNWLCFLNYVLKLIVDGSFGCICVQGRVSYVCTLVWTHSFLFWMLVCLPASSQRCTWTNHAYLPELLIFFLGLLGVRLMCWAETLQIVDFLLYALYIYIILFSVFVS